MVGYKQKRNIDALFSIICVPYVFSKLKNSLLLKSQI